MAVSKEKMILVRNLAAFWIFGLCNNYAYVIMLSAAEDIMDKQQHKEKNDTEKTCLDEIIEPHCSSTSTGAVLLADILPSLLIKITFPFFIQRIPFGIRHGIVCMLQVTCYLVVAYSTSVAMSLTGVVFAAMGSGLGEITYLSLSSHFPRSMISAWSSGTGGAGIVGSLAYAGLTEPHFANLSPKNACLVMLVVPVIFAIAYWFLMVAPDTVNQARFLEPKTWFISDQNMAVSSTFSTEDTHPRAVSEVNWSTEDVGSEKRRSTNSHKHEFVKQRKLSFKEQLLLIVPMLKYMIPLGTVYTGEYLINQGLMANAVFFTFDAIYFFVPHIWIIFVLILYEGLLGGSSYVNTFDRIHREVSPDVKEYCLSAASMGDAAGIVIAGFAAIPLHNFVCNQQKYHIH
ncbi:hypothetical protein FO519_006484 [Halicephalobus sp. NKZ332]|nr:hypothetical protein FO519_006484 [Halicephalobus sp. NKZ332]